MKQLIVICFVFLSVSLIVTAQPPEKMSYQAVIRNSANELITNSEVRIRISILQGSIMGNAVYFETHVLNTNSNGLVSLEIGNGVDKFGNFSKIKWGNGPFFIKTETDPSGGINYTITGTSQLLSVPYAFHSKTADSASYTINETDPVFLESVANTITELDKKRWNSKLDSTNEKDPIFSKSVAAGITKADTTYWNKKQERLTAGAGINITNNVISSTINERTDNFYLGQDTLGGIVFYIYIGKDKQQHGLIVAKTEIKAIWDSVFVVRNANSSWDGASNTSKMTHSHAKEYLKGLGPEWYIPAIDELKLLFDNRFHINKAMASGTLLTYSQHIDYWSSSEVDDSSSYDMYVSCLRGEPLVYNNSKNTNNKFRAIRAF